MSGVLSRMLSLRTAASRWVSFAGTVNNNAASVAILDGSGSTPIASAAVQLVTSQRFRNGPTGFEAVRRFDPREWTSALVQDQLRFSRGLASNQHRHSGSDVAPRVVGIPEINRSI